VMQELDASWWTQSALALAGWAVCTIFAAAHAWYDGAGKPAARPDAAATPASGQATTIRPVPAPTLASRREADSNAA